MPRRQPRLLSQRPDLFVSIALKAAWNFSFNSASGQRAFRKRQGGPDGRNANEFCFVWKSQAVSSNLVTRQGASSSASLVGASQRQLKLKSSLDKSRLPGIGKFTDYNCSKFCIPHLPDLRAQNAPQVKPVQDHFGPRKYGLTR